jgi:hypothetical protein
MFEYCKARHIDPSYEFFGTVDFGLRDLESDILLMYSVVNNRGQWIELSVMPPFQFDKFISMNRIKGSNLKEVFRSGMKMKGQKVEIKCAMVEKEALMPMVMKDTESLPPEGQAALESVIAETF